MLTRTTTSRRVDFPCPSTRSTGIEPSPCTQAAALRGRGPVRNLVTLCCSPGLRAYLPEPLDAPTPFRPARVPTPRAPPPAWQRRSRAMHDLLPRERHTPNLTYNCSLFPGAERRGLPGPRPRRTGLAGG